MNSVSGRPADDPPAPHEIRVDGEIWDRYGWSDPDKSGMRKIDYIRLAYLGRGLESALEERGSLDYDPGTATDDLVAPSRIADLPTYDSKEVFKHDMLDLYRALAASVDPAAGDNDIEHPDSGTGRASGSGEWTEVIEREHATIERRHDGTTWTIHPQEESIEYRASRPEVVGRILWATGDERRPFHGAVRTHRGEGRGSTYTKLKDVLPQVLDDTGHPPNSATGEALKEIGRYYLDRAGKSPSDFFAAEG